MPPDSPSHTTANSTTTTTNSNSTNSTSTNNKRNNNNKSSSNSFLGVFVLSSKSSSSASSASTSNTKSVTKFSTETYSEVDELDEDEEDEEEEEEDEEDDEEVDQLDDDYEDDEEILLVKSPLINNTSHLIRKDNSTTSNSQPPISSSSSSTSIPTRIPIPVVSAARRLNPFPSTILLQSHSNNNSSRVPSSPPTFSRSSSGSSHSYKTDRSISLSPKVKKIKRDEQQHQPIASTSKLPPSPPTTSYSNHHKFNLPPSPSSTHSSRSNSNSNSNSNSQHSNSNSKSKSLNYILNSPSSSSIEDNDESIVEEEEGDNGGNGGRIRIQLETPPTDLAETEEEELKLISNLGKAKGGEEGDRGEGDENSDLELENELLRVGRSTTIDSNSTSTSTSSSSSNVVKGISKKKKRPTNSTKINSNSNKSKSKESIVIVENKSIIKNRFKKKGKQKEVLIPLEVESLDDDEEDEDVEMEDGDEDFNGTIKKKAKVVLKDVSKRSVCHHDRARNDRPKMACSNYPQCSLLYCEKCIRTHYAKMNIPFLANASFLCPSCLSACKCSACLTKYRNKEEKRLLALQNFTVYGLDPSNLGLESTSLRRLTRGITTPSGADTGTGTEAGVDGTETGTGTGIGVGIRLVRKVKRVKGYYYGSDEDYDGNSTSAPTTSITTSTTIPTIAAIPAITPTISESKPLAEEEEDDDDAIIVNRNSNHLKASNNNNQSMVVDEQPEPQAQPQPQPVVESIEMAIIPEEEDESDSIIIVNSPIKFSNSNSLTIRRPIKLTSNLPSIATLITSTSTSTPTPTSTSTSNAAVVNRTILPFPSTIITSSQRSKRKIHIHNNAGPMKLAPTPSSTTIIIPATTTSNISISSSKEDTETHQTRGASRRASWTPTTSSNSRPTSLRLTLNAQSSATAMVEENEDGTKKIKRGRPFGSLNLPRVEGVLNRREKKNLKDKEKKEKIELEKLLLLENGVEEGSRRKSMGDLPFSSHSNGKNKNKNSTHFNTTGSTFNPESNQSFFNSFPTNSDSNSDSSSYDSDSDSDSSTSSSTHPFYSRKSRWNTDLPKPITRKPISIEIDSANNTNGNKLIGSDRIVIWHEGPSRKKRRMSELALLTTATVDGNNQIIDSSPTILLSSVGPPGISNFNLLNEIIPVPMLIEIEEDAIPEELLPEEDLEDLELEKEGEVTIVQEGTESSAAIDSIPQVIVDGVTLDSAGELNGKEEDSMAGIETTKVDSIIPSKSTSPHSKDSKDASEPVDSFLEPTIRANSIRATTPSTPSASVYNLQLSPGKLFEGIISGSTPINKLISTRFAPSSSAGGGNISSSIDRSNIFPLFDDNSLNSLYSPPPRSDRSDLSLLPPFQQNTSSSTTTTTTGTSAGNGSNRRHLQQHLNFDSEELDNLNHQNNSLVGFNKAELDSFTNEQLGSAIRTVLRVGPQYFNPSLDLMVPSISIPIIPTSPSSPQSIQLDHHHHLQEQEQEQEQQDSTLLLPELNESISSPSSLASYLFTLPISDNGNGIILPSLIAPSTPTSSIIDRTSIRMSPSDVDAMIFEEIKKVETEDFIELDEIWLKDEGGNNTCF